MRNQRRSATGHLAPNWCTGRNRLQQGMGYLGRVNVQETMPACSGHRTSSITSPRRGMPRLTRFVSRPIDEFVFKEDKEEKHRRCILPMSPRPSTAIPQVPPVLLHYSVRENNSPDGLDLVDRTGYISSDGMYLVEQTELVDQTGYVDRAG